MKFVPRQAYRWLAAASLLFMVPLRGDSPLPAGTAETLPESSPYGEATAIRNIAYVANGTSRQTFDLYLPKEKTAAPWPFVVWMHGGAWELSSKEWNNVKYLVKNGFALAAIDYRLAPQDKFPAQIEDCNAALNYLVAHAASYGLDPKRFVIGGASAGGQLALLLGLARHEKEFSADPSLQPAAILDFFGPTDLASMLHDLEAAHSTEGIQLITRVVPQLLGASVESAPSKAKAASPINYVKSDAAPTLILHGTKDALVPVVQSERLHAKLDESQVKNELIILDGSPHDGPDFSTPEMEAKVLTFLRETTVKP